MYNYIAHVLHGLVKKYIQSLFPAVFLVYLFESVVLLECSLIAILVLHTYDAFPFLLNRISLLLF